MILGEQGRRDEGELWEALVSPNPCTPVREKVRRHPLLTHPFPSDGNSSILLYREMFNSSGPFVQHTPLPGRGFSLWAAPMEQGGSPGKDGARARARATHW